MIRPLLFTVLAAASIAVTPPRATARGGPALQSPGDKTTLQIHSIDEDTFEPEGLATHENWHLKHKDAVRPFEANGNAYLFGLSRWTGSYKILRVQGGVRGRQGGGARGRGEVEPGLGSGRVLSARRPNILDSLSAGGSPNLEGGKVGVKRVGDDGKLAPGWHQTPGDGFWTEGYSTFRVIQVPDAGQRLAIYKIHDGTLKILNLGGSGIGETVYSGNISAGWTDVVTYKKFGELLRIQVNDEGVPAFDFRRVRAFRQAIEAD